MTTNNKTFIPQMEKASQEDQAPTFGNRSHDKAAETREVIYGVIAVLSFLLNFLFCMILVKRPKYLKRPHNILLFTLAITDLLTGNSSFVSHFNYSFVFFSF